MSSQNTLFFLILILTPSPDIFSQSNAISFKLGSFEDNGEPFVGIVLNDFKIIDLAKANTQLNIEGKEIESPLNMKDLINRYNSGLRERIFNIINTINSTENNKPPAYVHNLEDVKILPPIMYPQIMVNTALNYTEHALEMEDVREDGVDGSAKPGIATAKTKRPGGIWEPNTQDRRWNPYMFLKSPSAIIAHGESIRLPNKRLKIDWECELGIVIGKTASNVSLPEAADYIFGYTLELDVSDREGRGDNRYGSDWLIGKSRDTFAPMGPFITPKEFINDPINMEITFTLNDMVMQDSNTNLMIHNVFEQVVYASNILTLSPGDIIATGTPSGVGSGRTPAIFLKSGDKTSCTYEGIGTLVNRVQ